MANILYRIGNYVRRAMPWSLRALRNPGVGKASVVYACLPSFLTLASRAEQLLFGIRFNTDQGRILAVRVPGIGWLGVPGGVHEPEKGGIVVLPPALVEATIVDEYDATAFLCEGQVVVDVGACAGAFSLLASVLVGRNGRIVAIEPVPQNYDALCRTVGLNHLANVTTVRAAIGERCGFLRLSLADEPGRHSAVFERSDRDIEVPMVTLDELCAEQGLERLDFLKIDVEGFEPQVLRGARESIARFRPVIAAAAYHLPEHRELLPAMIHEMAPDYEIRVGSPAPRLDLKCFAVPRERFAGGRA